MSFNVRWTHNSGRKYSWISSEAGIAEGSHHIYAWELEGTQIKCQNSFTHMNIFLSTMFNSKIHKWHQQQFQPRLENENWLEFEWPKNI